MMVVVNATGLEYDETPRWEEDWPLPQRGDMVQLTDGTQLIVNGVRWFPQGESDMPEPYVYLQLEKIA